jgi:predicted transcriptional regulator
MIEKQYRVREVAKILGLTPYTVRQYLNNGTLRGYKLNTDTTAKNASWRVTETALKEYLESKHG